MHSNLTDHLLQTISWTFVHSLWLGLVLSVCTGLIMLLTRRSAASVRYILLTGSFFLFLSVLVIVFLLEYTTAGNANSNILRAAGESAANGFLQHPWLQGIISNISGFLLGNASWIVLVWFSVIMFKAAKMTLDLLYVSRLRTRDNQPATQEWNARLNVLAESIGIYRAVSMVESALTKVPVVIGHFRPLILMPAGILNNLSVAEIEAVLLHELAHIRRHDYLVNFIQRIVETILFFNPAVLWVSSLMRIEREHCCDDIAIEKAASRLQFAEALIRFKEFSMKPEQYAMGLFGRKTELLHRMTRIVYKRNRTLSVFEIAFFSVNVIVLFLLMLAKDVKQQDPPASYSSQVPSIQPGTIFVVSVVRPGNQPSVELKQSRVTGERKVKERPVTGHIKEEEKATVEVQESRTRLLSAESERLNEIVMQQQQSIQEMGSVEHQRLRAEHDRLEAEARRQQAEEQRKLATIARQHAEADRAIAALHREQAERDRHEAQKERERAERDRAEAEMLRKKAEEDRKRNYTLYHS